MRSYLIIILLVIFNLGAMPLFAQTETPATTGTVKGIIRDSVHNYVLKSATVSVFRADSSVLNYQLSNNFGEFKFSNLPIGQKLRLDISNVGYDLIRKTFTIPKGQTSLDLKTLIINPRTETLLDVNITIPPISYNNDTLEINAIAFKLDTNATVEDLLKKIPNITVWGDGIITVNGKEVKTLTVNGKSFFGGDNKIALQNIPKNALEKIQIFNTADKNNLLDSNLVANLKLKKGKDRSYFGKISAGYGTDKHYQFDGNINFSTPKLQLAIIGASNDINKIPNDINTLIRNSTYKGVGTSVEYQPDFRQNGVNKGNVGGAQFTYNFTPDSKEWNNNSKVTADYYFKNQESINLSDNQSTTTIAANNQIFSESKNSNFSTNNTHKINSVYNYYKKSHRLDLSQYFTLSNGDNTSTNFRNARNNDGQLTSTNNSSSESTSDNKNFNFRANYAYNNYNDWKQRFKSIRATYNLNASENTNNRTEITAFRDLINANKNQDFNRKYQTTDKFFNQSLDFTIPNLKALLFGNNKELWNIDAEITSNFDLNHNSQQNFIADLNSSGNYQPNAYLSNNVQLDQIEYTPGFKLRKSFSKNLSNRYNKSLSISLTAAQQFINQDNKSTKSFQNISRSYNNFVPQAEIGLSNYQYGTYQQSLNLNYKTSIRIPNLNQLAPLTDSTNLYNLQRGNINLKEATDRSINLSFNHYDMKNKNTLNFYVTGAVGSIVNDIVDSVFIDQQNRRTTYLTNASGTRYARFYGNIRKSQKFKNSELQLTLNSSLNFDKKPTYFNGIFNLSNNINTSNSIASNFTYKDKLGLEASETVSTSFSKQQALNTQYRNLTLTTAISTNYNFTKKLALSSNISFNQNKPSVGETINFAIWNANATYRFTKGNNAEIKLSALDLLHQNRSVYNYAGVNSISTSTRNVLQQYFMATLSYYPRKFGNTDSGKK